MMHGLTKVTGQSRELEKYLAKNFGIWLGSLFGDVSTFVSPWLRSSNWPNKARLSWGLGGREGGGREPK